MQVVARIVGRQHLLRVARVAGRLVEVDHAVIGLARSNPLVQRLSLRFADVRVIAGAPEGRQRRAENLHAPGVSPHDQLLVSGDEVLGGGRRILPRVADVVDPFHDDDVRHAWMAQCVDLETRERVDSRAVRAFAERHDCRRYRR